MSNTDGNGDQDDSAIARGQGAFIPPSDTYCRPDLPEIDDDWVVEDVETLEEAGFSSCPICHEEDDL